MVREETLDVHPDLEPLLNVNFGWAASSLSFMSRPPDPVLRDDWQVHTETWAELSCDAEWFYLEARLQAFEGGERFIDRRWKTRRRRRWV